MAQTCDLLGDDQTARRLDEERAALSWRGEGVNMPSRARMQAAIQAREG